MKSKLKWPFKGGTKRNLDVTPSRGVETGVLSLPSALARLIEDGVWPSTDGPSMTEQELRPIIPSERVRRFAAEHSLICLQPPPFLTIAQLQGPKCADEFWETFGALDQIVPDKALDIGDFGLGSDSAIILDFHSNPINPPVLYLQWRERGNGNRWVQGARDFDEFAEMLGLGLKPSD